MPYGLCSAPRAFQKIVSSVLKGIDGCVNLLDDIVIHGHTQEQHDTRPQLVLTRLAEYHVTRTREKCQFATSEIDFLGYHSYSSGVLPLHSYVKAIEDLPEPTNIMEVASFLGTTNFYLKVVLHYSETAEPLRRTPNC